MICARSIAATRIVSPSMSGPARKFPNGRTRRLPPRGRIAFRYLPDAGRVSRRQEDQAGGCQGAGVPCGPAEEEVDVVRWRGPRRRADGGSGHAAAALPVAGEVLAAFLGPRADDGAEIQASRVR